jgi:hypothetical protein
MSSLALAALRRPLQSVRLLGPIALGEDFLGDEDAIQ